MYKRIQSMELQMKQMEKEITSLKAAKASVAVSENENEDHDDAKTDTEDETTENTGNDAFITNRLWINTKWKATEHLSFSGQLAYNKAYGARSG